MPVRDEAENLPAMLAALAAQTRVADIALCLFLDGCRDDSRAVVQARAASLPFAVMVREGPRGAPNAGHARRSAMAIGLDVLAGSEGVLLTTDADSTPANDWVAACVVALAQADIVAGRIVRAGDGDARQDRVEVYYDRLHALRRQLDPVAWEHPDAHHCTGGANLGSRASVYRALGGFQSVPCGEDARLVDDAGRAGFRVRRDPDCIVHTSSRRHGRAPGGLAAALRDLDDGAGGISVGHPEDAAWQYRRQAQARAGFTRLDDPAVLARLAAALSLSGDHVIGVARDCPNAEGFAMRIVPAPPHGVRQVPLHRAERALEALAVGQMAVMA